MLARAHNYHLPLPLKAHADGQNKSQHCCVLLGFFGQQCCVCLHGPKSLTGFKLYATSAQHVGPNNVASVCMDLNVGPAGVRAANFQPKVRYSNYRDNRLSVERMLLN